MYLCTSDFTFH